MWNKLLGLAILIITIPLSAIIFEAIPLRIFIWVPGAIWVGGIALGFSLMSYRRGMKRLCVLELLQKYLVFGGYMGALIGLIATLQGFGQNPQAEKLAVSLATSLLPILYGYLAAYILETFIPEQKTEGV